MSRITTNAFLDDVRATKRRPLEVVPELPEPRSASRAIPKPCWPGPACPTTSRTRFAALARRVPRRRRAVRRRRATTTRRSPAARRPGRHRPQPHPPRPGPAAQGAARVTAVPPADGGLHPDDDAVGLPGRRADARRAGRRARLTSRAAPRASSWLERAASRARHGPRRCPPSTRRSASSSGTLRQGPKPRSRRSRSGSRDGLIVDVVGLVLDPRGRDRCTTARTTSPADAATCSHDAHRVVRPVSVRSVAPRPAPTYGGLPSVPRRALPVRPARRWRGGSHAASYSTTGDGIGVDVDRGTAHEPSSRGCRPERTPPWSRSTGEPWVSR